MSKKQQKPALRLAGHNIYTDKKNRTIFYDFWSKRGYMVEKKDENKMAFYQNRLVIILFTAILCAGTFLTWKQAVLAGVILFAVTEVYYRVSVFKKLSTTDEVDFHKRVSPLQSILYHKSRGRVLALAVLYPLFSLLVLLNAYMENYSMGLNVLSVCLAVLGLYCCALHVVALTKMQ